MRTLGDWFALSVCVLIAGVVVGVVGYIWGDRFEPLQYFLHYGSVGTVAGFAGTVFIGLELLRRRFP